MQTSADVNWFLIEEHCLLNKVTTVDVPPVKGNQKKQTFFLKRLYFASSLISFILKLSVWWAWNNLDIQSRFPYKTILFQLINIFLLEYCDIKFCELPRRIFALIWRWTSLFRTFRGLIWPFLTLLKQRFVSLKIDDSKFKDRNFLGIQGNEAILKF